MIQQLKTILKISRPKFWLYLAGTYLLGYVIGSTAQTELFSFHFLSSFIFFLIPANIFLYGINDYFDEDTDKYNLRKKKEEHRVKSSEKKVLRNTLFVTLLIGVIYFLTAQSFFVKITLIIFFALSYFYSSPPLRFKSKILVDAASNILYILPGLIGYYQQSSILPDTTIVIACFCWAIAMQLFSSIPDIKADKMAGLSTTAVFFGQEKALLICTLLWSIFSIVLFKTNALFPFSVILFLYPIIPIILLMRKQIQLDNVYRSFSYINNFTGFLFFIIIFIQKPYA